MRQILLTLFLLTITTPILAQNSDSVLVSGRLFTTENEQFSEKSPAEGGVVDIYPRRFKTLIRYLNYEGFEKLRVKRCYVKEDGSFSTTLPASEKYYIRAYNPESDIAEKKISTRKRDIDLGEVTLPEMVTIKGEIIPDPSEIKYFEDREELYRSSIYTKRSKWIEMIYINDSLDYRKEVTVSADSTDDNNRFEFKLRRGEYLLNIFGCGHAEEKIEVKSKDRDLKEIRLSHIKVCLDNTPMKKMVGRKVYKQLEAAREIYEEE